MARTLAAPLLFSWASVRSRTRLTVEKAVSAEEKNADKKTRTNNVMICMTPVVSNEMFTPCSIVNKICYVVYYMYNVLRQAVRMSELPHVAVITEILLWNIRMCQVFPWHGIYN